MIQPRGKRARYVMATDGLPRWWVVSMAWRDSRGSRTRFLFAAGVIAVGIAALTAISSFRENVQAAVNLQAKSLLGADLVLSSRRPFSAEAETLIATFPGDRSREVSFSSMAYFPSVNGSRLAQIRAIDGDFPYYGILETDPPAAARSFRSGVNALVDDGLLRQFDVQVGEPIQIGATTFQISGRLKKIPGEAAASALLGPRVYIPMTTLSQTALIQKESLITYKVAFRFPSGTDVNRLLEPLHSQLSILRLEIDTVEKRTARVGKVMENLLRFLNLVGFVAVLLGGVGVASAIHVYMREKLATVAILRCLGARARRTFAIYLTQAAGLGLLGGVFGVLAGVAVQHLLSQVLSDFLPVKITVTMAWIGIAKGLTIGVGVAFLFALFPLLPTRLVSPLAALRVNYDSPATASADPLRYVLSVVIVLSICLFAITHTERWIQSAIFCGVLLAAFSLLVAVAHFLIRTVRTYFSPSWPYVWRQGLANLYRPNNQTLVLILALGMGTFLVGTLSLIQQTLIQQVIRVSEGNQPNLVLFDIQSDQREAVANVVRSFSLPVLQEAALVTMRLASIKGESVVDIHKSANERIPEWALQWEYRATYRQHLIETETIVAGTWVSTAQDLSSISVSLEEEIARTLGVTLGDKVTFDVQGIPLSATVTSLRKVDWQRVQPNFFVVFPAGVLETAPQTYVLVTRTETSEQSAAIQRMLVQRFPNVSSVDLTMILQTFDAILQRIAFAIQFMGFFSLISGLLVFMSTVVTSRYQRIRENVLLRTLGASRRQLHSMLTIEYLFLGGFAALAGLLLAILGGWVLAKFLFEVTFTVSARFLVLAWLLVIVVTVGVGLLGCRGVTSRPPLEVLRDDG